MQLKVSTPVSSQYQYRGDLSDTTLPEMLQTVYRFQVPGMIEARRRGLIKRVYIKDGTILHASSSDIQDSLGSFLRRAGKITEEQFETTMALRRRETGKRYGAVLVDQGLLSPEDVYETIRQQIEAIVWSLFYWQEGEVSFSIGDHLEPSVFRIHLPMPQVILRGIRRAPNAKELVARMGQRETVLEPSYSVESLIGLALTAAEYAVLKLVDGERSLYEICTRGPMKAAENAKLLYGFKVLQLIRVAGESPTQE